jgi:hypothetical protein
MQQQSQAHAWAARIASRRNKDLVIGERKHIPAINRTNESTISASQGSETDAAGTFLCYSFRYLTLTYCAGDRAGLIVDSWVMDVMLCGPLYE